MKKLLYPAVFKKEHTGYSVVFLDLPGCNTEGDTLDEAYEMAFDALGLYLEALGEYPIPVPNIDVKTNKDEMLVLVEFDFLKYNAKHSRKSIKKTLTIPAWLNTEAEKRHINFSKVLQAALKRELDIVN